MELIKLQRSCHGKSATATYAFAGFKLNVYIRHNAPCKNMFGNFYVSAFKNPNNGNAGSAVGFDNYLAFKKYRQGLIEQENKNQ